MLLASRVDVESQGSPEGGFLGDADFGSQHETALVEVAQQLRVAIADLTDTGALSLTQF